MGLVHELQRDAIDPNVKSSILLRKALIVATKLEISEFKLWISREQNGYANVKSLPHYRDVVCDIKAWNPVNGWIPVMIHPKLLKIMSHRPIFQPISEVESLLESGSGEFHIGFPLDLARTIVGNEYVELGILPHSCVQQSQLHRILDSVRNTVVAYSLQLEADGIVGEGMSFSAKEKSVATKHRHTYHIKNFYGVATNVAAGKAMSVFDQRGQNVSYQYNAGNDINFGNLKSRNELATELNKLKNEIANAHEADIIDDELALDVEHKIGKAALLVKKPDSEKAQILHWLSDAKDIVKGLSAAGAIHAGIKEAIEAAKHIL